MTDEEALKEIDRQEKRFGEVKSWDEEVGDCQEGVTRSRRTRSGAM